MWACGTRFSENNSLGFLEVRVSRLGKLPQLEPLLQTWSSSCSLELPCVNSMGYLGHSPGMAFSRQVEAHVTARSSALVNMTELVYLVRPWRLHSIDFGSYKLPGYRGTCRPSLPGLPITETVGDQSTVLGWEKVLQPPLRHTMSGVSGRGRPMSK